MNIFTFIRIGEVQIRKLIVATIGSIYYVRKTFCSNGIVDGIVIYNNVIIFVHNILSIKHKAYLGSID